MFEERKRWTSMWDRELAQSFQSDGRKLEVVETGYTMVPRTESLGIPMVRKLGTQSFSSAENPVKANHWA